MDKKLISIIVPIYNSELFLEKSIKSIMNQLYKNIEIILVDDGSTDRSPIICDELAKKDERIRVIHKENNGAAAARNTGIECAKGDYIAFVDSDDYIDCQMYDEMMKINDQYDCDIVMCDCFKEGNDTRTLFTHPIRKGYYDKENLVNEYFSSLLMTNSVDYPASISNCLMLFKRNMIENNNLRYKTGIRFSEDLLFGSQAMYYADHFYYMKGNAFYHYVMNNASVTHTYYENKWEMMKRLYDEINTTFSSLSDYDFSRQIDLTLLYIVYHCINNVKNGDFDKQVKKVKILEILRNKHVKEMFKRIHINSLDISWKLKIITYVYKYELLFLILR